MCEMLLVMSRTCFDPLIGLLLAGLDEVNQNQKGVGFSGKPIWDFGEGGVFWSFHIYFVLFICSAFF